VLKRDAAAVCESRSCDPASREFKHFSAELDPINRYSFVLTKKGVRKPPVPIADD
jgi:hypothetical protein